MEYISREAALKRLQMQLLNLEIDQDNGEYSELCENRGARDALDEAIYDIKTLKASDVQPVKHGRWLPSDSCITAAYGTIHCQICSECGADLMEDSDYDYDFCPVCGARMDE